MRSEVAVSWEGLAAGEEREERVREVDFTEAGSRGEPEEAREEREEAKPPAMERARAVVASAVETGSLELA